MAARRTLWFKRKANDDDDSEDVTENDGAAPAVNVHVDVAAAIAPLSLIDRLYDGVSYKYHPKIYFLLVV